MSVPLLLPFCVALATAFVSVPATGSSAVAAQQPTPPEQKPTPPPVDGDAPLAGDDGVRLVAGELPASTDAATRAAWNKLLTATLGSDGERKPVSAFSLEIDVLFKARVETTNQGAGLYEYMAPGFVRMRYKDSRREVLRGPAGDWVVDPVRGDVFRIERSRNEQEDTRQLDDMVAIGRNFVALTDPKNLRIASLAKLAEAPAGLLPAHAKRGKELVWLDFTSPDFRLPRSKAAAKLHRVQLGLDPKTSLPEFALVHEGSAKGGLTPASIFLLLSDWFDASGYQVPKKVQLWEVDEALPMRFRRDPTSDVYLIRATMNPSLKPEAFVPAKKS